MTKTKVQTYWYDQWDKGQPRPEPEPPLTSHRRHCLITLTAWRRPHITPAHPTNPDLTTQFSRN